MELIVAVILLILIVVIAVSVSSFKKEMKRKGHYRDFLDDAIDAVEHNFSSNKNYAYTSTKGISFSKSADKKIKVVSQSKLCGTAISK